MATKVKGITIELSADASGLETALKNANKALSQTQRELNSVNRALKLDPGNTELIEQKQRMLARAIDQTTSKLNALKQAQSKIDTGTGAGQSQYDALTREISETSVKLNNLNTEQAKFKQEAMQAGTSTSAFSQGLATVGSTAEMVAQKTAMLSAAAAAALGGMVSLAMGAAADADELMTLSQQTGLSTRSLQELKYASEQIDVPLSTITGAITNMKRNLDKNADAWERIGVQVRTQQGEYRNIEDIFNDTVKAIGNIGNETERDTTAMKIFGKSANELAGLLDDGGAKMRALGQEAEDMGVIVSDADLQKLGHFNDLLDQMKTQMQFAAMQAAIPIMEALAPMMQKVAQAVQTLAKVLSALPSPVVKVLAIFLTLVAVLSPVAMGIALVCNALNMLTTTLPAVGAAIGQMISAASAFIAGNPYVGVILAIIAALALLAFAIYEIIAHWEELSAAGNQAWNSVKSAASNALGSFESVAQNIKTALGSIPSVLGQIGDAFKRLAKEAASVVSQVISAFQSLQDKARNAGEKVMSSFADGITSVIQKVISAVQRLISAMSNLWSSAEKDASNAGRRTADAYIQSYNSSSSMARLTAPTVRPNTVTGASINTLNSSGPLTAAINTLASNVSGASASPTNITVELVGSAKNIFDTVRVQNNVLATATGYHALA